MPDQLVDLYHTLDTEYHLLSRTGMALGLTTYGVLEGLAAAGIGNAITEMGQFNQSTPLVLQSGALGGAVVGGAVGLVYGLLPFNYSHTTALRTIIYSTGMRTFIALQPFLIAAYGAVGAAILSATAYREDEVNVGFITVSTFVGGAILAGGVLGIGALVSTANAVHSNWAR